MGIVPNPPQQRRVRHRPERASRRRQSDAVHLRQRIGDGLLDGFEVDNGFHPLLIGEQNQDPDGDGLSNLQEQAALTDPNDADSDDDGLLDGDEIELLTDPLDPDSDDDGVCVVPLERADTILAASLEKVAQEEQTNAGTAAGTLPVDQMGLGEPEVIGG